MRPGLDESVWEITIIIIVIKRKEVNKEKLAWAAMTKRGLMSYWEQKGLVSVWKREGHVKGRDKNRVRVLSPLEIINSHLDILSTVQYLTFIIIIKYREEFSFVFLLDNCIDKRMLSLLVNKQSCRILYFFFFFKVILSVHIIADDNVLALLLFL